MNSFQFCLASLLLALCAASSATAQSWAYPDWPEYDSTFYVGSDVAANVDVAMDELTIEYHWGYLEFIADFISRYQNPGNVGNLAHREFVLARRKEASRSSPVRTICEHSSTTLR